MLAKSVSSSAQQPFVDVVMKDVPESSSILAAEIARESFRHSVTDRVRMPQSFALDDLDEVIALLDRGYQHRLHGGYPRHGPSAGLMAESATNAAPAVVRRPNPDRLRS